MAEPLALDEGVRALKPQTPLDRFNVVSITPLALRADSRTLKQAASVHRLGYKSIVVEGRHSGIEPGSLPFDVISAVPPPEVPAAPLSAEQAGVTSQDVAKAEDDTSGCVPPSEAATAAPSFSQRWIKFCDHWSRNKASALRMAAKYAISFGQRIFRQGPMYIHYAIRRILDKIRFKLTLFNNKLKYNNFTAFLRHVSLNYRTHITPIRSVTPKANLYYLHAPYQFPAIALRCLIGKSKYIYDAHDFYSHMDDHTRLPSFWTSWVVPWENMIERWCVRHASAVVTVNQGIAQLMQARFGRDVIVLRNAHDPRLEGIPETTLRRSLGLPDEALLTVCIGQWKRDTAILQAMQAFAMLPGHHHLAFLGANFPSYAAEAAKLGVEGRVHFHPAVKADEVVPFVRSADLGLLLYHAVSPSIRNCLPNGFFQPLAAGLPVLYPELPEIARIAGPLDLGLPINPLDPNSIADAVLQFGKDASLRAVKKERVEAARHTLSWERDEEILKKLIEGLIGPPHAA